MDPLFIIETFNFNMYFFKGWYALSSKQSEAVVTALVLRTILLLSRSITINVKILSDRSERSAAHALDVVIAEIYHRPR